MISKKNIEELKQVADIVDIIENYVSLKKAGANFIGKCPFHDDKTPSFVVSNTKNMFHCYGCGSSGDAISFIQKIDSLDFQQAVEKIASMSNFTLTYENTPSEFKKSNLLNSLSSFFALSLKNTPSALLYLKQRGIKEQSIELFNLGYCPSSYECIKFMQEQKLDFKQAKELGILLEGNDRSYIRFNKRLIFPINSSPLHVVGFGGRTLEANANAAKYINSSKSAIFNKSKILYGYFLAKSFALEQKRLIVVEGYLDVILLSQAGIKNVVATLGTALNEGHLSILNRIDVGIIMLYDGDKAGLSAASKASKFLASNNKDGGIALLKDGLDPADMVVNNKIEELKECIKNATSFIEFSISAIASEFNLDNPMQKNQALKSIIEFLKPVDILVKNEYKYFIAKLFNISVTLIDFKSTDLASQASSNLMANPEEAILSTMMQDKSSYFLGINYLHQKQFVIYKDEFNALAKMGWHSLQGMQDIKQEDTLKHLDILEQKDEGIWGENMQDLQEDKDKDLVNKQASKPLNTHLQNSLDSIIFKANSLKHEDFTSQLISLIQFYCIRELEILKGLNLDLDSILKRNVELNRALAKLRGGVLVYVE